MLRALARENFDASLEICGLMGFSRPIRVVLLEEDNPVARETPSWVSGYARGDRALIVLFPARVPSYPDRNLGALLHHEVTHILVWEAAGGRFVPRWFNEGVATVAAREWGLEDRARYATAVIGGGPRNLRDLDRAFERGNSAVGRAYALSAGLVRALRSEYGPQVTGEILAGIREGLNFDAAFRQNTGRRPEEWASGFLRMRNFRNMWLPFLSSENALWLAMSLLALAAIVKHRLGRRRRLNALDETDGEGEEPGDPEHSSFFER